MTTPMDTTPLHPEADLVITVSQDAYELAASMVNVMKYPLFAEVSLRNGTQLQGTVTFSTDDGELKLVIRRHEDLAIIDASVPVTEVAVPYEDVATIHFP